MEVPLPKGCASRCDIEKFQFDKPSTWPDWLEFLNRYLLSARLTTADDDFKISELILCMGPPSNAVFQRCSLTTDKKKSYVKVTKMFTVHFHGARNIVYELARLHRTVKHEGETLDSFIDAVYAQAENCDFDNVKVSAKELLTQSQLIAFMANRELAKWFTLEQPASNDPPNISPPACVNERVGAQVDALRVRILSQRYQETVHCPNCGHAEHSSMRFCPALGKTCNACWKIGHVLAKSDLLPTRLSGLDYQYIVRSCRCASLALLVAFHLPLSLRVRLSTAVITCSLSLNYLQRLEATAETVDAYLQSSPKNESLVVSQPDGDNNDCSANLPGNCSGGGGGGMFWRNTTSFPPGCPDLTISISYGLVAVLRWLCWLPFIYRYHYVFVYPPLLLRVRLVNRFSLKQGHFAKMCRSKRIRASNTVAVDERSQHSSRTESTPAEQAYFLGKVRVQRKGTVDATRSSSPWRVNLLLNGKLVCFKLDFGADVTCLPERLAGVPAKLSSVADILGPSNRPLKVLGSFPAILKCRQHFVKELCYVIRDLNEALRSPDASIRLHSKGTLRETDGRPRSTGH
uniref:Peptidase A2 domain-containing protein n=1 Tax=Trichuris muris TaxID=70415 RepID=A0A5S6Q6A6_TRIMR